MRQQHVWVRKFYTYLTPHTISTHLRLAAITSDPLDFIRNRGTLTCDLLKQGFSRRKSIQEQVRFVQEQAIAQVVCPEAYYDQPIRPVTFTSVGLTGRHYDGQTGLGLLCDNGTITASAKVIHSGNSEFDWKLIDRHACVLQSAVFPQSTERRRTSCHFNNWNDLVFLYFSTILSLFSARRELDAEGTILDSERRRLIVTCDIFDQLQSFTHWRDSLTALASLQAPAISIQTLREDLRKKGISMTVTNTNCTIGTQQIGSNNRIQIMQQHLNAIAGQNPASSQLLKTLDDLGVLVAASSLHDYAKDEVCHKIAVLAEEATKPDEKKDTGKIKYVLQSISSIVESVAAAIPLVTQISQWLGKYL